MDNEGHKVVEMGASHLKEKFHSSIYFDGQAVVIVLGIKFCGIIV